MKEQISTRDELDLQVYHSLYMYFPTQIRALNDLKKHTRKYAPNAIDLMYIPVFTSFIESVFSEVYEEYLQKNQTKFQSEQYVKLFPKVIKDISFGTWGIYMRHFELVFGVNINDVIPESVLNAIQMIYEFRNQSQHGKQIQHNIFKAGNIYEESAHLAGNYKKLNDYFLNNHLLTKKELLSITFINDNIVSHFLNNVKLFSSHLAENIMKKGGLKIYQTFKTLVLDELETL